MGVGARRRVARSKAWVNGRLGLIEGLPDRVLKGVSSGKIAIPGTVYSSCPVT